MLDWIAMKFPWANRQSLTVTSIKTTSKKNNFSLFLSLSPIDVAKENNFEIFYKQNVVTQFCITHGFADKKDHLHYTDELMN